MRTALPMSHSTTTPAPSFTSAAARRTRSALVPIVPSGSPPAVATGAGVPAPTSAPARAAVDSATSRLCETSTTPTRPTGSGAATASTRVSASGAAAHRWGSVASYSAVTSSAEEAAPGSSWPTLRSPR